VEGVSKLPAYLFQAAILIGGGLLFPNDFPQQRNLSVSRKRDDLAGCGKQGFYEGGKRNHGTLQLSAREYRLWPCGAT
jgi:hypothetical protein